MAVVLSLLSPLWLVSMIREVRVQGERQDQLAQVYRSLPHHVPVAKAGTPAYLKGKLIVVDAEKREIHSWHRDLPAELRADQPSEIGTIVTVKIETEQSGSLGSWIASSRGPGNIRYQHRARFRIIDPSIPTELVSETFVGQWPERIKAGAMFVHSTKPSSGDLLRFLEKIPRKGTHPGSP